MRRSGKRRMSPTAAMNVAATITLTPGTVISRLTSGQDSASAAISCSTSAISASRKSTWRTAESTVSRSAERQLLLGQPAPALDAEQIRRRRPVLQAAHQHRVDLVLRARARPHQLRPAREPAAHRADRARPASTPRRAGPPTAAWPALGRRGDRSSPGPGGSRCRSARRRSRARRAARGSARSPTRCRSPPARPSRARSRLCANSSSASGRGLDPAGRAQPALRDDRHLAEVAVDIQRYRSHLVLLAVATDGRTGGQTTSTDPRSQRNRASRRGGH